VFKDRRFRAAAGVAAVCAVGGVIAGIAGSAAAPSGSKSTATNAAARKRWAPGRRGLRHHLGGPIVHGQLVVPNQSGTGFDNVTIDEGKVKSVSGDQLTVTEGTDKATYKTVTLTIPSNAVVRRNWSSAKLSDVRPGDRVHVLVGPRGTFVGANDSNHTFPGPGRGWRHFRGPGPDGPPGPPGPPGPGGPGGPPPPGMP
jgi:hypothetical protein